MISGVGNSDMMSMMQMMRPPTRMQGGNPTENVNSLIQDRDTDGNGSLSVDEIGVSEEVFGHIDSDGDGEASFQELLDNRPDARQGPPPMMEMMMGGSGGLIEQLYGGDNGSTGFEAALLEYESLDMAV